jgi:hypothetical protein
MLVTVETKNGIQNLDVQVINLVIAGWAGRDRAATEHHIAELEALGVARPKSIPSFYRVSAARLTTSECIEVMGENSSGEVECVILSSDGRLYVGLGSDHTDRKVESYGVTASKQICDKPVSSQFWLFDDVVDHWDELRLLSYTHIDGARKLYQEGAVSRLTHPQNLSSQFAAGGSLPDKTAMFCGTVPAIGGIQIASEFECVLEDPVLNRRLELHYSIKPLAIAD